MNILVFQHHPREHAASLGQYMKEDGHTLHIIELNAGVPIPSLENYDMLLVLGGAMDVWEIDEHPWLLDEKKAIKKWVSELQRPFLGICLGHQLLADALGGKCELAQTPEIGILDAHLNTDGKEDPVFNALASDHKYLQWHGVEVTRMPKDGVALAYSDNCPIQAMRVGKNAWSTQFHIEIEPETVKNWTSIPSYKKHLEEHLGTGAAESFCDDAETHINAMLSNSRAFYDTLMKHVTSTE